MLMNSISDLGVLMPVLSRLKSVYFSQYGEDVLLHSLCPRPRGFYVDVGAYHPWEGSNTFKLYCKGWEGVTIDPNPDIGPEFQRVRPRDTHVTAGVAMEACKLSYHRYEDEKLNTFAPDEHRSQMQLRSQAEAVACRPLKDILEEHAPGCHVDLLSVDCEGMDLDVIRSLELGKNRPSAILIEDIDQYQANRDAGDVSATRTHLGDHDYCCVGQAMFSFLYVDRRRLEQLNQARGFNFRDSQLLA